MQWHVGLFIRGSTDCGGIYVPTHPPVNDELSMPGKYMNRCKQNKPGIVGTTVEEMI